MVKNFTLCIPEHMNQNERDFIKAYGNGSAEDKQRSLRKLTMSERKELSSYYRTINDVIKQTNENNFILEYRRISPMPSS